MNKPPAFQLYAADFYMDTLTWETDDIGVYFCLLMAEWVNGPLENDTRKLAKIAKKTHKKFNKNWSKINQKFVLNSDGKLQNSRLEETRQLQNEYREKAAISGRKGGLTTQEKRREQSGEPSSKPSSEPSSKPSSQIEALQSSSSSSSIIIKAEDGVVDNSKKDQNKTLKDLFEKVLEKYPMDRKCNWHLFLQNHNRCHPEAMIHTLEAILKANGEVKNPTAYCEAIIKIENQNYNERDHIKKAGEFKKVGAFTLMADLMPATLKQTS